MIKFARTSLYKDSNTDSDNKQKKEINFNEDPN